MKIQTFINDKDAVEKWLSEAARSIEEQGFYFSHWNHEDGIGFGLVITADKSGEFHLMANGDVTSHVESFNYKTKNFDVLGSEWRRVAHVHEFEQMYADFKNLVLSDA